MSNYGSSRYPRSLINERSRPRFHPPPPQNRHAQRDNRNDHRSPLNKPTNISQQQPFPTNETPISKSPNSNSNDLLIESSDKSTKISTTSENTSTQSTSDLLSESSNPSADKKTDSNLSDQNNKSPITSISHSQSNERKTTSNGRCRLFIGNIPIDLTQEEFKVLFGKYGELIEYFVNPSRGFGFVKLSSRQLAEQAKHDLDGYILRGKSLRIRFACQGATIKVKNLSPNVSNELLKEAFEQYFGTVDRAIVIVDDRGKSIGEGIIEFEKKTSAQKCLNECTERSFFLTSELKPVIVEPWDLKDEEDGLPEKSLIRNPAYVKEREMKPHFAEINTIEHTIGLKWKELELQEKQLLEEVKRRMQYAAEQVQIEIDKLYLEHQSQLLREELLRRQEDLRRIDELRTYEINQRRNMSPMHYSFDAFKHAFNIPDISINNRFHQYANSSSMIQQSPPIITPIDAAYTTNQAARGYGLVNKRTNGDDYFHSHGFDRKRPRY